MTEQKNPEVLADEHLDDASGGYKLTNVLVSSYQTGGSAGGGRPMGQETSTDPGGLAHKDIKRG